MQVLISKKKIIDRLEEAYNDVLIWNEDDDWNRGIKEGIYIAMSKVNGISGQNIDEDAISRQAAIDALGDEPWACTETKYKLGMQAQWESDVETLKNLPSVQPEVIRCKDCIYQTESWSGIKYCEAHGDHIGKDYDYCSNARRKDNG